MHARELSQNALAEHLFYCDGDDYFWLSYAESFFVRLTDSLNVRYLTKLNSLGDVVENAFSYGLFEDKQIVVVKDADYKQKGNDKTFLNQLLTEDLADTYVLFLYSQMLSAADKKKLSAIDCKRLDRMRTAETVREYFSDIGGIEPRAVDLLCEYTNLDMAKIAMEEEKLRSYCEGRVKAEDVAAVVVEDTELQVYRFVNALTSKQLSLAVSLLDRLKKRGEAPALMLASLQKQYRRLLYAGLSPLGDAELAKLFGVKDFAIKKCREGRINKRKVKAALDMLSDYEYRFKSGELSEQRAFDMAVSELLSR